MSTAKHSVIRLPGVLAKTGLSRSSIYAAMGRNEFPASITLGPRAVGWLEADIDAWLESRIRSSRDNRLDRAAARPAGLTARRPGELQLQRNVIKGGDSGNKI